MQTKNLSKPDYYKSRNITIPKPPHKLAPQPPVRLHLLEPMPSLAIQIRRHLQALKNRENLEVQHLGFQPTLHELQVRLQDMSKLLANREDEVTSLKNEKQKDERRIMFLDRQVFNFKAQLHKIEYEYKSTIELLKIQNSTQKSQFLQKFAFLEEQARKAKEDYANLMKNTKESYESRIQSYQGTKQSLKLASEELMNGLKLQIQYHIGQNTRLRNQLILNQKQTVETLRHYEEQNFVLKQKIQQMELEHSLRIMKMDTQTNVRNGKIKDLNDQIQDILRTFEIEKQKILYEKQYLEKVKTEKQNRLKQNILTLISDKQKTQIDLTKALNQLTQLKETNSQNEKKLIETTNKISFLQSEKIQNQTTFRQKIEEIRENQKVQFQNQIQSIKKNHEHKFNLIEKDLTEKSNQIFLLQENILKLTQQIDQKSILIRSLQQKQKTNKAEFEAMIEKNEQLYRDNKVFRKEIQILRVDHQNEKRLLLNKIQQERSSELLQVVKQSKQIIMALKKQINETKNSSQIQLKTLSEQVGIKTKQIERILQQSKDLKRQKLQLNTKIESLKVQYQEELTHHKTYTLELQKVIQEETENKIRNSENIEHLKVECIKARDSLSEKQAQLLKVEKQLKQSRIQHDQVKLQSIRKCAQFQEKIQSKYDHLEREKHQLLLSLKKTQNQVTNLNTKLEYASQTIKNLQKQKEVYASQSQRLKDSFAKKQQNANSLLNQIDLERNKLTEQISQQFKEKNIVLKQKCESFMNQVNDLKRANYQIMQSINKSQALMRQMGRLLESKDSQLKQSVKQNQKGKEQITKLEAKINLINNGLKKHESEKKKIQAQTQMLTLRIAEFQNKAPDMKKSNLYEQDLSQELKFKLNRLLVIMQEMKMDRDYQKEKKQSIQKFYHELKDQIQNKNLQIESLQQSMPTKIQMLVKEISDVKIKQLRKNLVNQIEELKQKIDHLTKEIVEKNKQITKLNQSLVEYKQLLEGYEQKQQKYTKKDQAYRQFEKKIVEMHQELTNRTQTVKQQKQVINAQEIEIHRLMFTTQNQIEQCRKRQGIVIDTLNSIREKYESSVKKSEQIERDLSSQIIKLKQTSVSQDEEIQNMRKQIIELEIKRDKMLQEIQTKSREHQNTILRLRVEHQQKVNSLKDQNLERQRIEELLRIQLASLNDQIQKLKIQNLEIQALKNSFEADFISRCQQLALCKKTISQLTNQNQFLLRFRQMWYKVSGDVMTLNSIDVADPKKFDESFSHSIKNSTIIDPQLFPKTEIDRLFLEQRNLFQSRLIQSQQERQEEGQKKEEILKEVRSQKNEETLIEIKISQKEEIFKEIKTQKKEKNFNYNEAMAKTKRCDTQEMIEEANNEQ